MKGTSDSHVHFLSGVVGQHLVCNIPGHVGWWDLHVRGLHAPDFLSVLLDGSVAGELPRGGNVSDHHLGPFLGILERSQQEVSLGVHPPEIGPSGPNAAMHHRPYLKGLAGSRILGQGNATH